MINYNGIEYRNLVEQVEKNKQDIAKHYDADRVLGEFGVKVLGKYDNYSDIENFDEGENYGNAYLVGTTEPYDVYVWTRANENTGHDTPYWLNIGPISIVGPVGPEGPQGPQGEPGEASKWYVINVPGTFNAGDQLLDNNGNVYTAVEGQDGSLDWELKANIKGPQGVQGAQGPKGDKGDMGPQGPRGATGDPGAFIKIAGTLTSTSQLPSPTTINDMNLAYLVGNNKLLYIQVGTTPDDAVWTNIGELNAGTYVTSGGSFQNIWDADTKLDFNPPVNNGVTELVTVERTSQGVTRQGKLVGAVGGGPSTVYTVALRSTEGELRAATPTTMQANTLINYSYFGSNTEILFSVTFYNASKTKICKVKFMGPKSLVLNKNNISSFLSGHTENILLLNIKDTNTSSYTVSANQVTSMIGGTIITSINYISNKPDDFGTVSTYDFATNFGSNYTISINK